MSGRGGWSRIGMPANGTGYYQLLAPEQVGAHPEIDSSHQAVTFGVRALQKRINGLGYTPALDPAGVFDDKTNAALIWAQKKLGVAADGQCGPKTSVAMFWPLVKEIAGPIAHTVGGIAAHESAYDPGAVGFSTPDDHGLVQINAPANPQVTLAQAFDPRFAFTYCTNRINNALAAFHGNLDCAICSYASPQWANEWFITGHAPNVAMQTYVDWVKAWVAPTT